jgi:hypothetical protein
MPLIADAGRPSMFIRKSAYESAQLERADIDARFNLTDQEFRVEGGLVAIGPLPSDDLIGPLIEYLEQRGLSYFDDFFELSGNWPQWLSVYVAQRVDRRS